MIISDIFEERPKRFRKRLCEQELPVRQVQEYLIYQVVGINVKCSSIGAGLDYLAARGVLTEPVSTL